MSQLAALQPLSGALICSLSRIRASQIYMLHLRVPIGRKGRASFVCLLVPVKQNSCTSGLQVTCPSGPAHSAGEQLTSMPIGLFIEHQHCILDLASDLIRMRANHGMRELAPENLATGSVRCIYLRVRTAQSRTSHRPAWSAPRGRRRTPSWCE